jgi:PAS domain S-box-containing protein
MRSAAPAVLRSFRASAPIPAQSRYGAFRANAAGGGPVPDISIDMTGLGLLDEAFAPLIHNPFFVKDRSLRYVAANRAMLDLCGVRYRSELIGRTARDMYARADADRYELDERQILKGVEIVDRVEEIHAARRGPVWLILSQRPLRDAAGRIAGVIGVSRRLRENFASDRRFAGFAAALQAVRDQFDKPLNCPQLASVAGLSVSQFERDFKTVLGVTPRLYQQRVRIEEALRLIAQDEPIAQVAQLCGFSDHSAFARRFRLVTGMTPTKYRSGRAEAQLKTTITAITRP